MKKLIATSILVVVCAACAHKDQPAEAPAALTTDPTVAATPAVSSVTTAQALMKPGKNQKTQGILHFTQHGDKMKIQGMLEKLKPGPHGIHIHETGDCSAPDFSSAGGHYNPGHSGHGSLSSAERHAGDLGNITANSKGSAKVSLEVTTVSLGAIVGKALVVHASADDFKTQPSGNSGDRIACGVIEAN